MKNEKIIANVGVKKIFITTCPVCKWIIIIDELFYNDKMYITKKCDYCEAKFKIHTCDTLDKVELENILDKK